MKRPTVSDLPTLHAFDLRITCSGRSWTVRAFLNSGHKYCAEMTESVFCGFCEHIGVSFAVMSDAFADASFRGPMVIDDIELAREDLRRFGFVNPQ